jgi:hypothetical protein
VIDLAPGRGGCNHLIFDVNTNINPAMIEHLDAPIGSAFFWKDHRFIPDPSGAPNRDEILH